ncbi:MAG: fibro-slime domain-containing protein, partial [Polyangiales bacterium]
NGKLVIDLGGVHGAEDAEVDLDARAAELGITKGKVYPLDFFFAERHTSESTFRIDTTLDFVSCGGEIK